MKESSIAPKQNSSSLPAFLFPFTQSTCLLFRHNHTHQHITAANNIVVTNKEEGRRHQHQPHNSGEASNAMNILRRKASTSRGKTRSSSRGRDVVPQSPSTSATESSTDTSSSESRQSRPYSKSVSGERSSSSRFYPPPPPLPPPPLRLDQRVNVAIRKDKDDCISIQSSRSRSYDQRYEQEREGPKSRQQLLRPSTASRSSSSTKEKSSGSSTTQTKSRNGSIRSQSRSTNHHDGHRGQQEQTDRPRQSGTSLSCSSKNVSSRHSKEKEKSSHQLDRSGRAGGHTITSTIHTKSTTVTTTREKSSERKQSSVDIIPTPTLRPKMHRNSEQTTTSTISSSTKSSGHRGDNTDSSSHSRRLIPTTPNSNVAQLDSHGCCIFHPIVQLQRRSSSGRGWRILSTTCALCIKEAKEKESNRDTPPRNRVNKERHQLEQDHSKFNTTTARRRSIVHEVPPYVSTDSSLESSPQVEDNEECSITLSCLESDDDEPPSAVSSSASSSIPMKQGSKKSPATIPTNNRTLHPSDRSSDSPSVSATSQKSHKSQTSHKSHTSHRSVTCSEKYKDSKQDEHAYVDKVVALDDNGRLSSEETESKKSSKPSTPRRSSSTAAYRDDKTRKQGADIINRAEAALRRIKLLEKMADGSTTTSSSSIKEQSTTASSQDGSSHSRSRSTSKPRQGRITVERTDAKRCSSKTSNSVLNHATKGADSKAHPDIPSIDIVVSQLQMMTPGAPHSPLARTIFPQKSDEMSEFHQQPESNKDWMKYATTASARESADESSGIAKKASKLIGRTPTNLTNSQRKKVWKVKQMPYCDQFGDHGIYTGHVNEDGKPDGSGSMKYENGVFYEGTWTDGCQDAAAQYARIRSGFTSWGGKGKSATKSGMVLPWNARKNDAHDGKEKSNVRGMEWIDMKGHSGRYTGEVNGDQIPHGNGMMRYDFGLIAEGEWVRGVLKEGPHDHLVAAMGGGQSVVSGMQRINSSLSLGSRSVGFPSGAVSVVSGGGMSGFMPPSIMQFMPSPHVMMAHQNAVMNYGSAVGSVYGGAGSVYSSAGLPIPVQQIQYVPMPQQHQGPPVPNIFIS
ncbi:hypothetical protein ACHAXH_004253 [Discostella pseudostelligera]